MTTQENKPVIDEAQIRARQQARAKVLALALGAFVILVFAISIIKMTGKG